MSLKDLVEKKRRFKVPHFDGDLEVDAKITEDFQVVELKGKGIKNPKTNSIGSYFVTFSVQIPEVKDNEILDQLRKVS